MKPHTTTHPAPELVSRAATRAETRAAAGTAPQAAASAAASAEVRPEIHPEVRTEAATKTVRDGNAAKRAAILDAARELFLRDGVERSSMDAVASLASVSKRTVYDYFGDKRGLLLGLIESLASSLVELVHNAVTRCLDDDILIATPQQLEAALTNFAIALSSEVLVSSAYTFTTRLIYENSSLLPELENHPTLRAPETALTERIQHFSDIGLLDVSEAPLAVEHFKALTLLLALNHAPTGAAGPEQREQIMRSGVHAFMRAYGAR